MSIDSTIGALEIGTLTSGVLFGLITSQTYVYFKTYPRDSLITKSMVAALWIVELAHTACIFDTIYMYTVKAYGDPSSLVRFPIALDVTIILHGATVILVQLFFCHRICQFVKRTYYLSILAVVILIVRFIAFIVSGVFALRMNTLLDFMHSWKSLILFDLISCAATDVIMSGTLVWQLAQKRAGAYKSTLAIMDKLILWSVETCLVTTTTTIVMMICFLTMGEKNFVWIGILLVQPKIFSNAMLANLNSRASFHEPGSNIHEMTPSASSGFSKPQFSPGPGSSKFTVSREYETFDDKFRGRRGTEATFEDVARLEKSQGSIGVELEEHTIVLAPTSESRPETATV